MHTQILKDMQAIVQLYAEGERHTTEGDMLSDEIKLRLMYGKDLRARENVTPIHRKTHTELLLELEVIVFGEIGT